MYIFILQQNKRKAIYGVLIGRECSSFSALSELFCAHDRGHDLDCDHGPCLYDCEGRNARENRVSLRHDAAATTTGIGDFPSLFVPVLVPHVPILRILCLLLPPTRDSLLAIIVVLLDIGGELPAYPPSPFLPLASLVLPVPTDFVV
jgi:hypothetical protein